MLLVSGLKRARFSSEMRGHTHTQTQSRFRANTNRMRWQAHNVPATTQNRKHRRHRFAA